MRDSTEVDSSDDVSLVKVLDGFGQGRDAHFYFGLCGKEMPEQNLPRVSRENVERLL